MQHDSLLPPNPLEQSDQWPAIQAALRAGRSPGAVAADFGVPSGELHAAMRRTRARGQARIVRRLAHDPEPPAARIDAMDAMAPKPRRKRSRSSPGLQRVAKLHHLVGVVTDGQIAEQAGVHVNTVRTYRKLHDVAAAPRGARKVPTTPAINATVDMPTRSAWRVVLADGTARVAFGATLVEVAQRVAEAELTSVRRIEHVGLLLT